MYLEMILSVTNSQIVNGKIPDELLRKITAGVTKLSLYGCSNLKTLPKKLPQGLKELNLYACYKLKTLPKKLPLGIEDLDLGECSSLKTPPNLPPNLKKLGLRFYSLNTLPKLPPTLQDLNLGGCRNLNILLNLNLPPNLRKLNLSGSPILVNPTNLPQNLEELKLTFCSNLTTIQDLPPNLRKLNLSRCSSLTTIPDLPQSLSFLNLSGCNQLSPESITRLRAFEDANQNPDFQIIWPENFPGRLIDDTQIIDNLKNSYREYHSSNPYFAGRDPDIFDQVNYPTLFLFHRFTSESLENRSKNQVVRSAFLVAQEIKNNPQLLEIFDMKSRYYLAECVNQPVCGFAEIAALVEIAKQDNITAKIQKAKILRVQQLIKNNIRTLKNSNGNIVGNGVQVEVGNAMLREVHKKLLAENIIYQSWPGIPGNIAYEATIRSFLTDDNIEIMSNLAKEALLPTHDSKQETIDFLCEVETDFWAMTILEKEEREIDNKRINKLKDEILDLNPNETNLINQIQKQIQEIQINQSKNLAKKLQEKTQDLLEADEISLQNLISPAPIEPNTTTNPQNDPAGGVFGQGSESNQSLYRRLRESELSQIGLSEDMFILAGEPQPTPDIQPQSFQPNTSSNLSGDNISRNMTNDRGTSALIGKIKNKCCVIN